MKRPLAAGSDDEAEVEAEAEVVVVSNYHLVDDDEVPVCFSVLPVQWGGDSERTIDACKEEVFLHGSTDNGLQKVFMQVTAWRFDLSPVKPEVSLLSKDGKWVKLDKPRKSFQDTVRTIFVTLHFLHSLKKNPRLSAKSVWNSLSKDKELSFCEFKPSQKDLLDHVTLIGEASKRDAVLAKSKLLLMVMEENRRNGKLSVEEAKDLARPEFIVDDIGNETIDEADEDPEEESDSSYTVCAFCDNGGALLCCDGECMRSFHATKADGKDSDCFSLGLTRKEVDDIKTFYCSNCKYHQHQCFACGKLGSSDKAKGAKVFKCAATCDCFYHPHCVAKLLSRVVKLAATELERNIANGDPFTCPVHYCHVCKEEENAVEPELQFAVCRRCPKSYHRKCLPRNIALECTDDGDIVQRAWEGLLPNNRILIYCLNHKIDNKLGTPIRNHIKFPVTKATVREINTPNKRMKHATQERVILQKNNAGLDKSPGKSTSKISNVTGKLSSGEVGSKKRPGNMISSSNMPKKLKLNETPSCLTENKKSTPKKFERSEQTKHDSQFDDVDNETLSIKPISTLPPLDGDSEKRNHKIDNDLGTLVKDNIKLPSTKATVREINTPNNRMKPGTKERVELKNNAGLANSSGKSTSKRSKATGILSFGKAGSEKRPGKMSSSSTISKKPKLNETLSCVTENKKPTPKNFERPEQTKPVGQFNDVANETLSMKQKSNETSCCVAENKKPTPKEFEMPEQTKPDSQFDDVVPLSIEPISSLPPLDGDSERRRELGVDSTDKMQAPEHEKSEVEPDHSQPSPIDGKTSVESLQPISDIGRTREKVPLFEHGVSHCRSKEEEKNQRESKIRQLGGSCGVQENGTREPSISVPQHGWGDVRRGFAPGPYHAYVHKNSAGWLDE